MNNFLQWVVIILLAIGMILMKLGEKRIEIRFDREFPKGRTRVNCTINDKGKWRWTGFQFFYP